MTLVSNFEWFEFFRGLGVWSVVRVEDVLEFKDLNEMTKFAER